MSGLLDAIMGASPDQTPDAYGTTNQDRSQIGFNSLANMGAILMAAGQPMQGSDRARYLAMLGQVPGQAMQQRQALVQGKMQKQQLEAAQRQNTAAKTISDMAGGLDTSTLTPAQGSLLKAAFLSGDPSKVAAVMQQQYTETKPQLNANGDAVYRDPKTGQWFMSNPLLGINQPLSGGQQGQAGLSGGGQAQTADLQEIDPTTGLREKMLARVPDNLRDQVRKTAVGDMAIPPLGSRNPRSQQIIALASQVNPNLDQTTFGLRQKAKNDLSPNGTTGKAIISLNTLLQHTAEARQDAEKLPGHDLPLANSIQNWVDSNVLGGSAQNNFELTKGKMARELDNLLSGGHVTVSETEALKKELNAAQSPTQIQDALDHYTRLAAARLQSLSTQSQHSLGRDTYKDIAGQLNNDEGLKAYNYLQSNPLKGSTRYQQAQAAAKKAQGAQAQPAQQQAAPTADPTDADINYLMKNPGTRARFDKHFGAGASNAVLGQ